jgi:hypothetical protein
MMPKEEEEEEKAVWGDSVFRFRFCLDCDFTLGSFTLLCRFLGVVICFLGGILAVFFLSFVKCDV